MMLRLKERSAFLASINVILLFSGLLALFFLLTNGVPLIQAGWINEWQKKSRYVRLMLISVPVFAAILLGVRLRWPHLFPKLWCVRSWNALCGIPLKFTVPVFFIIYAAIMAAVGFERHLVLETRAFDLGIFAQAVWNTLQGDFFFSSIKENINLMGDHVSPILLGTVPFYAIWPDPRMLVLLQAIAVASSFFPLALIARGKLKNRSLVLIFLLMFFFYQPMRAALHEDFHPEVLAEPFLWWAFFFLEKKKIACFLLCLAVAVTGKENFLGIAFMFGVYAFVWKKMRSMGIFIALVSAGIFIWETKWLVPHLSGAKYFYSANYALMPANLSISLVPKIFTAERLGYAIKVFSPFIYLPFLHVPTLCLTLPIFLQNLISSSGGMRSFNYHYFTGLTPFLFISTIYALARAEHQKTWIGKHLVWAGFLLLFVSVLRSGVSEYWFFWNYRSHRSAHFDMIREKLREIPRSARVLTHNAFIPQACDRKYIYQFSYNVPPDKLFFAKKYAADVVVWDRRFWENDMESMESALKQFLLVGFSLKFEQDGFYILWRS